MQDIIFRMDENRFLTTGFELIREKNYNNILPREHFSDVFVDVLSC